MRIRVAGAVGVAAVVAAVLGTSLALSGQGTDYVQANYTKYEYRIAMRDGVKLFTAVYVPKDASQTYPILMNRTPYSVAPYGASAYKTSLGPSDLFAKEGYIFVYQDVRGRMMSEGEFMDVRPHQPVKKGPADIDESTDTWDTIEWLVKHVPGHNGRVGMYGISYPGFYSAAGMIDAHPALKAVSPQAPIADWFIGDDFHHNGALYLPHAFGFLSGFGRPRTGPTTAFPPRFDYGTADGYQFYLKLGPMANVNARYFKGDIAFWTQMMEHETYDAFWQARNLRPHLKNIKPAVMTVGGWYDAEDLFGALETYKHTERQSPGASNMLVMGPWVHGGWARGDGDKLGDVSFASKTGPFYREQMELPFFQFHLKDKADPKLPEAYLFETGRNQWRRHDAWPPKAAVMKALFLRAPGALHQRRGHRDDPGTHGGRPALRRGAPGRAGVPDRAPRAGRHRGRPHRCQPEGVDDRDRRGLGGQGDRRLSRQSPGTAAGGRRRLVLQARRLPAVDPRRGHARQVPQQLRETRALRARAGDRRRVHAAGRVPHVPHGAPHHGARAEFVVPAGEHEPADVPEHQHRDGGGFPEGHAARPSRQGRRVGGEAQHSPVVQGLSPARHVRLKPDATNM